MTFKSPLAWNGGVKPKRPSEGFATSVGMTLSGGSADAPAAALAPRSVESGATFFDGTDEGLQVDVRRMGEQVGPEVVRPSGRVRFPPG